MQIGNLPILKKLGECIPGELVQVESYGTAFFCLTLQVVTNGVAIGVLTDQDAPSGPYRDIWNGDVPCLSWGTDWFLDPLLGSETRPGNYDYADRSGTLLIFEGNIIGMWFRREPRRGLANPSLIEMPAMTPLALERHDGVPVPRWQIWLRADDRKVPGRSPIVDFTAMGPTAH
jgi:hypothetical protein